MEAVRDAAITVACFAIILFIGFWTGIGVQMLPDILRIIAKYAE